MTINVQFIAENIKKSLICSDFS